MSYGNYTYHKININIFKKHRIQNVGGVTCLFSFPYTKCLDLRRTCSWCSEQPHQGSRNATPWAVLRKSNNFVYEKLKTHPPHFVYEKQKTVIYLFCNMYNFHNSYFEFFFEF